MKTYPLAKPIITPADRQAVLAVLKTDSLSLGPKYAEFENKFARKLGVKYACAVSSGTAGLHLALLAAGVKSGDEVITTPFSFVASANVILYVGAKPVFVDINPATYNLDASQIEKKITKRTKAILPVHIFGQPCDLKPIMRLAKKYRLEVIEDVCESLGATYRGRPAGTFGLAGVFAFYPNKQMTTGEGGMIVTNNKKVYELCDSLRNQGRAKNLQWLDHERLGFNYRLDEMSAALGISQLSRLDYFVKERRKIASWYGEFLKPHVNLIEAPRTAADNSHSWFVYVIKIKNVKLDRDRLMLNLKKAGVATKPYLPSIHLFAFYKKRFGFKAGDFPLSEAASRSTLALPIYPGLKRDDCRLIVERLVKEINNLNHK